MVMAERVLAIKIPPASYFYQRRHQLDLAVVTDKFQHHGAMVSACRFSGCSSVSTEDAVSGRWGMAQADQTTGQFSSAGSEAE